MTKKVRNSTIVHSLTSPHQTPSYVCPNPLQSCIFQNYLITTILRFIPFSDLPGNFISIVQKQLINKSTAE